MTYYDDMSDGYDELHGAEQLRKARIVASRLNVDRNSTLLDVGCGTGSYLDLFGCKVIGIDPSKELIAKYKGKHTLVQGEAENLLFADRSFDHVISLTAIHNFNDIEKGLLEMRRVGRGSFAFSILKRSPKFAQIERLIRKHFMVKERVEESKDIVFFLANI